MHTSVEVSTVLVGQPATADSNANIQLVRVRASATDNGHAVTIAGLPANAAETTGDRLYAAFANAGLVRPGGAIRLDIHPAAFTTGDGGIDAAIAVALLAATGHVPSAAVEGAVVIGELGLDGALRTPRLMPQRLAAASGAGFRKAIVPFTSRQQAADHPTLIAWPFHHLRDLAAALRPDTSTGTGWPTPGIPAGDLADLAAAHPMRQVLEVAAAGGHHLALIGPAGEAGVFARRLPGLLPDLDQQQGRAVADLYRAPGLVPNHVRALRRPPWQQPHHTVTIPALIGSPRRPGMLSLAHHGLLFLDDVGQCSSRAIEVVRHTVDTGQITLAGADLAVTVPSRTQLVLAARPCPCVDPAGCACTSARQRRYQRKLESLLDRVEIRALVHPADAPALGGGESSATVAARVAAARAAAAQRWMAYGVLGSGTNHDVPGDVLRRSVRRLRVALLAPVAARLTAGACTSRAATNLLRLAWTAADLAGRDRLRADDIATAVSLSATQSA